MNSPLGEFLGGREIFPLTSQAGNKPPFTVLLLPLTLQACTCLQIFDVFTVFRFYKSSTSVCWLAVPTEVHGSLWKCQDIQPQIWSPTVPSRIIAFSRPWLNRQAETKVIPRSLSSEAAEQTRALRLQLHPSSSSYLSYQTSGPRAKCRLQPIWFGLHDVFIKLEFIISI